MANRTGRCLGAAALVWGAWWKLAADMSRRCIGCMECNPSLEWWCLSARDPSWTLMPKGQKAVKSWTAISLCLSGSYCRFTDKSNAAQCSFQSQVEKLVRERAPEQRVLPRQFCRSTGSQCTCGNTRWFLCLSIVASSGSWALWKICIFLSWWSCP